MVAAPPAEALYIAGVVVLVPCTALLSGLTLGLLSLDPLQLEVQRASGGRAAARAAARLLPLVARTHQALVGLVLCNAALSAALPLCLDRLLDPLAAILISSTAVVLFSEILPQAVFSRYSTQVCAFFAPLMTALLWLFAPAAFPLAALLDAALGAPGGDVLLERTELRAVIALHAQEGNGGPLSVEEVSLLSGALELTATPTAAAMTPAAEAAGLRAGDAVDAALLQRVLRGGGAQVLVRGSCSDDIIGAVSMQNLVASWASTLAAPSSGGGGASGAAASAAARVGDLPLRRLPRLAASAPLYEALALFKREPGLQVALVVADPPEAATPRSQEQTSGDGRGSSRGSSGSGGAGGDEAPGDLSLPGERGSGVAAGGKPAALGGSCSMRQVQVHVLADELSLSGQAAAPLADGDSGAAAGQHQGPAGAGAEAASGGPAQGWQHWFGRRSCDLPVPACPNGHQQGPRRQSGDAHRDGGSAAAALPSGGGWRRSASLLGLVGRRGGASSSGQPGAAAPRSPPPAAPWASAAAAAAAAAAAEDITYTVWSAWGDPGSTPRKLCSFRGLRGLPAQLAVNPLFRDAGPGAHGSQGASPSATAPSSRAATPRGAARPLGGALGGGGGLMARRLLSLDVPRARARLAAAAAAGRLRLRGSRRPGSRARAACCSKSRDVLTALVGFEVTCHALPQPGALHHQQPPVVTSRRPSQEQQQQQQQQQEPLESAATAPAQARVMAPTARPSTWPGVRPPRLQLPAGPEGGSLPTTPGATGAQPGQPPQRTPQHRPLQRQLLVSMSRHQLGPAVALVSPRLRPQHYAAAPMSPRLLPHASPRLMSHGGTAAAQHWRLLSLMGDPGAPLGRGAPQQQQLPLPAPGSYASSSAPGAFSSLPPGQAPGQGPRASARPAALHRFSGSGHAPAGE
ncbi:MAG: hypothetical protein J3K34DRAFT_458445 [Monoraphidium minutum]|nr:MAG: hypothetical protein J3K34DRAFT_458445 [Monoraphidium minutum]